MDDAADRYDYTDTLDPPDAPWDERDEDDGRADAGFYDRADEYPVEVNR